MHTKAINHPTVTTTHHRSHITHTSTIDASFLLSFFCHRSTTVSNPVTTSIIVRRRHPATAVKKVPPALTCYHLTHINQYIQNGARTSVCLTSVLRLPLLLRAPRHSDHAHCSPPLFI